MSGLFSELRTCFCQVSHPSSSVIQHIVSVLYRLYPDSFLPLKRDNTTLNVVAIIVVMLQANLISVNVKASVFRVHIPRTQFHLFTSHTSPLLIHTSARYHGNCISVLVFHILTLSYCCSPCPPIVKLRGWVCRSAEPPSDTPWVKPYSCCFCLFHD